MPSKWERDGVGELRKQLFEEWPKYSGHACWPVPGHGTEEDDGLVYEYVMGRCNEELDFDDQPRLAEMYFDAVKEGVLHNGNFWTGRYGYLRRELMQFMIDELQKEAIA